MSYAHCLLEKAWVRGKFYQYSFTSVYIYDDLPIPEFFVLLHRSQNSRMDDQRGILDLKSIEMPDFLKVQEAPKKRNNPLLVGVPSPRPAHHPLKKTTSSPPSYATWASKHQGNRPAVITEESRDTLSRFTRNWSGTARGKVHVATVTETQTIDRKRFFKHSQNETAGRLRAGSLPYTHPDDRCNDIAGGNELRTRVRYHYESETSLNNNNTEVVWVANTLSKNRMRSSTKTDISKDAGYESTTDDEGISRNFKQTEVIIPQGNTNTDQLAVPGSVVPSRDLSTSKSPYFCENMATAKRHVRTLAEPSSTRDFTSGNDRQAILDNSFLRDQLQPSRLFSQFSPDPNSPIVTSSPKERNGTPMKCPLFTPPGNRYSDEFTEVGQSFKARDKHVDAANIEPRVCWEAKEQKNEEGNVRVTFV